MCGTESVRPPRVAARPCAYHDYFARWAFTGELRFCEAKWEFCKLPSNFSDGSPEHGAGDLPIPAKNLAAPWAWAGIRSGYHPIPARGSFLTEHAAGRGPFPSRKIPPHLFFFLTNPPISCKISHRQRRLSRGKGAFSAWLQAFEARKVPGVPCFQRARGGGSRVAGPGKNTRRAAS